ncbi:metalloregulator ArsR/SmtB family transcription factor [Aquiluna sp.]|nr:metalloregulator ArsR/SmtB family transcription factor [Aquiluna sp.]MDA8927225.1 metalloregulator ArsR/SmtB family transcription factor [Aquiluna sp.]
MADIFEAVADPTRRQLLESLLASNLAGGKGEMTVTELVDLTKLGQPTVSKHLKTLREVGLVAVREEGQKRYYSVTPEPLEEIEDWMINFLSLDFEDEDDQDYRSDDLAHNLAGVGEQLGHWLTERSSWLTDQLKSRASEIDVDFDASEMGKRLGRKLADAKSEAEKSVKDFERVAKQKVEEVIDDVKTETQHLADEVRKKTGKK